MCFYENILAYQKINMPESAIGFEPTYPPKIL